MSKKYDIAIIGTGPGGYVAAIRAAQIGMEVACIEKDSIGGVCLNWGCIPTKTLIKSADTWNEMQESRKLGLNFEKVNFDYKKIMKRSRKVAGRLSKGVEYLFKKNNIEVIKGEGKIVDPETIQVSGKEEQEISAENIIIATGAHPQQIPGVKIDGEKVISSKDALQKKQPPESLTIIGGGAIGVEFGYIFNSFGTDVTIVEMMPHLLPNEDSEIVNVLRREFKKKKINILTETKVTKINKTDGGVETILENDGEKDKITSENVLMSVGVAPNIEDIGLKNVGIETSKGAINIDENYQTSVGNIYAIGDVIGAPALAHVASEEGINAVEHIKGENAEKLDYNSVPFCTYSQPQVASVGYNEEEAQSKFDNIQTGTFQFRGNGKAMATGNISGMVKVIFNEENRLIGGSIIGSEATELLPELTMAVSNSLDYNTINSTIHAHPTLSEAIKEAILDAQDRSIHQ